MSNSVAPLPSGGGVTVIAEHRSRREQDPHHGARDEHPADPHDPARDGKAHDHHAHEAPPPPDDDPAVPAETLFAATLLASSLPHHAVSREELRLRTGQNWTPPDSLLRLKDKLI